MKSQQQKRTLGTASFLLPTFLGLGALVGCAGAPAPQAGYEAPAAQERIVVQGEMTDNGLGCSALRTADGTYYTLARELEGTKKGNRVRIEGDVLADRGCMVGVHLMPRRATALPPAPVVAAAGTGRR